MNENNRNTDIKTLPKWESESFCRYIAEATEKYMKDPKNKKRFEEWKKIQIELKRWNKNAIRLDRFFKN